MEHGHQVLVASHFIASRQRDNRDRDRQQRHKHTRHRDTRRHERDTHADTQTYTHTQTETHRDMRATYRKTHRDLQTQTHTDNTYFVSFFLNGERPGCTSLGTPTSPGTKPWRRAAREASIQGVPEVASPPPRLNSSAKSYLNIGRIWMASEGGGHKTTSCSLL